MSAQNNIQELRQREIAAIIGSAIKRADDATFALFEGIDDLLKTHKAQINVEADWLASEGFPDKAADIRSDNLGGAIFSGPTVAGALRSIIDGALDAYQPEPTPVPARLVA